MPTPQSKPQPEANPYMQMMQEDAPEDQAANPYALPVDTTPKDKTPPQQQPGMLDSLSKGLHSISDNRDDEGFGMNMLHRIAGNVISPVTTGVDMARSTPKENVATGLNAVGGALHFLPGGGGPDLREYAKSGHPYANMAGDVATTVVPAAIGAGMEAAQPYESPAFPPGTRAYQTLASKIGPESVPTGQKVLPGITENLQAEHPSILQFAQQSKIPLKTPEEYSLAAKGLRGQVTSKFYDELQKPFENDRLQVSPEVANYKVPGRIKPLGSHPTVGELNEALNAANEESGPIHQEGANAFDRTRVMAAENTARQIRQLLNEHLGEKSGQTPEQVGALRERGGALKNVEENAQARSVANRMAQSMSPFQATSLKSFLLRSGQSLLGGPEAIANRGFRSALGKVPAGTPTELPNFQLQPPGGATPPPTFSPAAKVAGPEPLAPPPVRMPPGRQKFSPPAVREGKTFNPRTGKYE